MALPTGFCLQAVDPVLLHRSRCGLFDATAFSGREMRRLMSRRAVYGWWWSFRSSRSHSLTDR
jgi:hypothetical protein